MEKEPTKKEIATTLFAYFVIGIITICGAILATGCSKTPECHHKSCTYVPLEDVTAFQPIGIWAVDFDSETVILDTADINSDTNLFDTIYCYSSKDFNKFCDIYFNSITPIIDFNRYFIMIGDRIKYIPSYEFKTDIDND